VSPGLAYDSGRVGDDVMRPTSGGVCLAIAACTPPQTVKQLGVGFAVTGSSMPAKITPRPRKPARQDDGGLRWNY
jgi:hypothetical protein